VRRRLVVGQGALGVVVLSRIYTRAGDGGTTRLAGGESLSKDSPRIRAIGAVDETNAVIGLARLQLADQPEVDAIFARVQNDLFDLGADLATPDRGEPLPYEPLRVLDSQVDRLERDLDGLNKALSPLTSFVLPAGSAASAHLHLARTVCRRAECEAVALSGIEGEAVSPAALKYLNRLSDLLFVAARFANGRGEHEVLWVPGGERA
jgi:cob(I)alamin adenosyltransferase